MAGFKSDLKPWQLEARDRMWKMPRHLLSADTGAGKSVVALSLINEAKKQGPCVALIACPNAAIPTWTSDTGEIRKHTDFSFSVNDLRTDVDINVLSLSQIKKNLANLYQINPGVNAILIVDEAHALKSEDSLQATMLRGGIGVLDGHREIFPSIIQNFKWAYGMTATPAMNHIEDIFYVVDSFFTGYYQNFDWFMDYYTIREKRIPYGQPNRAYWEITGFEHLEDLNESLKPIMFRKIMDYNPVIMRRDFELFPDEYIAYVAAAKGMLKYGRPKDFLARLPDLQQIVNGSLLLGGKKSHNPGFSSKESELITLCNEIADRGEGAIVFTNFLSSLDRLQHCRPKMRFENAFTMSGETAMDSRKKIVERIGPNDVLFCTKVGGVSLNLQAVNNVIFYDTPWSVGDVIQAIGRVTRINSTYTTFNAHFLTAKNTIDEYKFNLVLSNLAFLKQVVGGFNFFDPYFKEVARHSIIEMRKQMLWAIGN